MNENNIGRVSGMEMIFMRIVASVFLTGTLVLLQDTERVISIASLNQMSNLQYLGILVLVFAGLSLLQYIFRHVLELDVLVLVGATLLYVFVVALNTADIYYISMICVFTLAVLQYAMERHPQVFKFLEFKQKTVKKCLGILFVVTGIYLGCLVLLRLFLMKSVTFDFGIFVQMFYYMKETLIPYTTCERYELLSHFAVHFSPIYYLILPFYLLFPAQETLVIVQLLAVLSGVIPLYLMCRRKRMKGFVTLAVCAVYLLYPTLRGGLFYDFHENKFLAPLIMWLLYFFEEENERKKKIGVVVFTVLLLMVKEDAALYTACIGLYHSLVPKDTNHRVLGFCVFGGSLIYFFLVFGFMDIDRKSVV